MTTDRDFVPLTLPVREIQPATQVRGSVIISSLRSLRTRSIETDYYRALPEGYHSRIREVSATSWAPAELAVAHYGACDQLNLPRATIEAIGAETGAFLNSSVLSVLLRASREMGLSPWNALANIERLRERLWVGSMFSVTKIGPKEARVDWYGQPCGQFPYYRTAFGAFMAGIVRPMAKTLFIRPADKPTPFASLSYRFSWA